MIKNTAFRSLGLDLGTQTGWALAEGNKMVASGVRDFSIKSCDRRGKRGIKIYNFLLGIGHVDEIYVEKIAFGGNFKNKKGEWVSPSSDGRQLYHGLMMMVDVFAAGYDIPVFEINNATLKKAFTGHGFAKKEDMCRAAHHLGWRGGEQGTALYHDEADAIALIVTQMRERHGVTVTF